MMLFFLFLISKKDAKNKHNKRVQSLYMGCIKGIVKWTKENKKVPYTLGIIQSINEIYKG